MPPSYNLHPSDPIWQTIRAWKRGILEDLNARHVLWRAIWAESERDTGIRVQHPVRKTPYLVRGFPWVVYREVASQACGQPASSLDRSNFQIEERDGLVRALYGSDVLVARVPGDENRCVESLLKLTRKIASWDEAKAVAEAHRHAQQLTERALEVLEEIQLTHFLHGRCAVCRRLGV